MMRYPKVPRVGLDVIPDDFWSGELVAMEKADGSLFRFTMYDNEFEDAYPDTVTRLDPEDGNLVVGSARNVSWVVTEDGIRGSELRGFEESLRRLQKVDTDMIREYHDTYGPLVFFGEAMTGHLLEYDDAPAVVGFDVYAPFLAERDDIGMPLNHKIARLEPHELADNPEVETVEKIVRKPVTDEQGDVVKDEDGEIVTEETTEVEFADSVDERNIYSLTWDGFLSVERSMAIFTDIVLRPMHHNGNIPRVDGEEVRGGDIVVPQSQFASVKAEGIVFRSGNRRVKVRSDIFKEVKKHHATTNSNGDAPPTERFIAEFATPIRIMKTVTKMVEEDGRDLSMSLINDARERVWNDIWQEEWTTIKEKNYPIKNGDIKNRLAGKVADTVEKMVNNEDVLRPESADGEGTITFEN